jgi:metallo-beta-lactamase class B
MACAAAAVGALASAQVTVEVDPQFPCTGVCASWSAGQAPFRIHGGTYYVGGSRISSILIDGGDGLILVDGAFPGTAPIIARHIRELGFRVEDVKLIVNSHTHWDHVGGVAELQQASGAEVAASPAAAAAMEAGHAMPDDPQYRDTPDLDFPAVENVRRVSDSETLTVGEAAITVVFTPGHTPGGTSWTWRSCEDGDCLDIVYADSLNAVSAANYRFIDHPDMLQRLQNSMDRIAALPCDILIAPHPDQIGFLEKAATILEDGDDPFVDPRACGAYAKSARARLEAKLESERGR